MFLCATMGIMFTIHSRFSNFWEQDEILLLPDLFEFVTTSFYFCHLSSMLHISNT